MSRIAIAFFLVFFSTLAEAAQPTFWQSNAKKVNKKLEAREILVSAKSMPVADKRHHLRLQGIGQLSAPFDYARNWTANFDHLLRVSDYAKEVRWNPISRKLYLHTEAFGFHARMHMNVSQKDTKKMRTINFKIVRGAFSGMEGGLSIHKQRFSKSRVSIDASYYYQKWTMPKLFLEFGLEVVLQKFADRLRRLLEADFKQGRAAAPEKARDSEPEKSSRFEAPKVKVNESYFTHVE